jgi:hypothetical protein
MAVPTSTGAAAAQSVFGRAAAIQMATGDDGKGRTADVLEDATVSVYVMLVRPRLTLSDYGR